MDIKKLSELTDQELLAEAKKMKSKTILHALFIGGAIGVVIFGIAKSNIGFFSLVALYFVFKAFSNTENEKHNEALEKLLKERNLK